MEPDQSPATYPYRGALWLNGVLWALVLTLWAYALPNHTGLGFLAWMLSGGGVMLNLGTGFWLYAAEQRRAARWYLLGALLLGLFWWGLRLTTPSFLM